MAVHPYKKDLQEVAKSFRQMFQKSAMVRWSAGISTLFLIVTIVLPIWRILPLASQNPNDWTKTVNT